MSSFTLLRSPVFALFFTAAAFAFDAPQDAAGPLSVKLKGPEEVLSLDQPVQVVVTLSNSSDQPIAGDLRVALTDRWQVEGPAAQPFSLPPKASRDIEIPVRPAKDSYAAHYPVRALATVRNAPADKTTAEAVLVLEVSPKAIPSRPISFQKVSVPPRGAVRLDKLNLFRSVISVHGRGDAPQPIGWTGTEPATGGSVQVLDADRGGRRHAIAAHPPFRAGWGASSVEYRLALPASTPLSLEFATAIRDSGPSEPQSDGVQFDVFADAGSGFERLFSRFSAAKSWEPASVDLSRFAGKEITLRLTSDPGPAHNTVCDQSFWAEPVLLAGEPPREESDAARSARRERALRSAQSALKGAAQPWAWRMESDAGKVGVALIPGPAGLADAIMAFADPRRHVLFEGFNVEVDGEALGGARGMLNPDRVDASFREGRGELVHRITKNGVAIPVRAAVWSERGALRIAFSMPGVQRDSKGEPRFTRLAIGPASERAKRVYAGFGNVLENPGKFELHADGFNLSTRHVGVEFEGGFAVVQAADLFPDLLSVDPDQRRYALVTHHDATFSFVPSTLGAFAAARVYRGIAGFKPAAGVAKLGSRMCLDQWGGDYRAAADGIRNASRYGLTDTVFVKHDWQRWGYDNRLPDIYPPRNGLEPFRALADACREKGILFAPHDNYIDFYPDAEGFSYDCIEFNPNGAPQKAWFNKGRKAQSYRWLPTAFFPRMENNLRLIKEGVAPTSYFVDVFSAIQPADFVDRTGRFYPKTVTIERWGAAFDRIREVLGDNAPTISEAGHDALIGHLDAGQSDHSGWLPNVVSESENANFRWRMPAQDGERVPWHDMASHGSFVLFAGGLGHRYSGGEDNFLHGYGSDDYLSLTVLGGRNPMCDGPFSRRAVMTYWLLHDLCAAFARSEILSHQFAGDNIHRQVVQFSNGGWAYVNRGAGDWQVGRHLLPRYGMVAWTGDRSVSITRRDGVVSALAEAPGVLFADARPLHRELPKGDDPARRERLNPEGKVLDFGPVRTNGAFRLKHSGAEWELTPLPGSLAFQAVVNVDQLGSAGRRVSAIRAELLDGSNPGPVPFKQDGASVSLETQPNVFTYHIQFTETAAARANAR